MGWISLIWQVAANLSKPHPEFSTRPDPRLQVFLIYVGDESFSQNFPFLGDIYIYKEIYIVIFIYAILQIKKDIENPFLK